MGREGTSRKHLYICTRVYVHESVDVNVGVMMGSYAWARVWWWGEVIVYFIGKGISVIIMTYFFCGRI